MLYIALLHYPVLNRNGEIVTTSIANMDLHDIARAALTYGVRGFYIVNPIRAQRKLALEIMAHWQTGCGAAFNESRKEAFGIVRLTATLADAVSEIGAETGSSPGTVATGANFTSGLLAFRELKEMLGNDDLPYLVIFGTGWGLAEEIIGRADYRLEPIKGSGEYNHRAVRSAIAIVLDKIAGN
jgi:hypothetical protein